MIDSFSLTSVIENEEYDRRLTLSFSGTETIKLFDYSIYRFVYDSENELQIMLNFGGNKALPHTVKQLDEIVMFVPKFLDTEQIYRTSGLEGLDWKEYLEITKSQIFVFPKHCWTNLWQTLNISLGSLPAINQATSEDIFLLWLISSKFRPPLPLASFIPEYAQSLRKNILAENPEHHPSVKEVLSTMLTNPISIIAGSLDVEPKGGFIISAYWLAQSGSFQDWPALFVDSNQQMSLLLNGFYVKLLMSSSVF